MISDDIATAMERKNFRALETLLLTFNYKQL